MLQSALWFIRLMRPAHQAALVVIFLAVRYGIVRPWLQMNYLEDPLPEHQFFLALLGSLLLCCAAVLINDYFDWQDDRLARPEAVIVGRHLSRRTIIVWHGVLTVLGLLPLCYLSFVWGNLYLLFLFPFGARVLWYYSKLYKQRLIYSIPLLFLFLLSVPLLPLLFEFLAINRSLWQILSVNNLSVFGFLVSGGFYALLIAFLGLTRAFEKQIRYYAQRTSFRTETLPDRFGLQSAKMVVLSLKLLLFLLLFVIGVYFYGIAPNAQAGLIPLLYLGLFVGMPLLLSTVLGVLPTEQMPRWARFFTTTTSLFVILLPLLLVWF